MADRFASPGAVAEGLFFHFVIWTSAALVLWPAWRGLPAAKVLVGVMTVGMLVVMFRSQQRRKNLGLTFGEMVAQAKAGRKFTSTLEKAAMLMYLWATILVS